MRPNFAIIFSVCCSIFLCAFNAWAGPPFVTDDPEPVEYHHTEIYLASVYTHSVDGTTGTAPHIDANYGAAPEMHINLVAPLAYTSLPDNSLYYGLGDVSIGVKYRFVHETSWFPQIAVYPHLQLPTGQSSRSLGAGHTTLFLPVWLQKSFGEWTTYAGGGYWFNKTAAGDQDYWQAGWVLQRDVSRVFTFGAEVFTFTTAFKGGPGTEQLNILVAGPAETGVDAGVIINFSEEHHFLFSAGSDTNGPNEHFAYAAFQWTTGGWR